MCPALGAATFGFSGGGTCGLQPPTRELAVGASSSHVWPPVPGPGTARCLAHLEEAAPGVPLPPRQRSGQGSGSSPPPCRGAGATPTFLPSRQTWGSPMFRWASLWVLGLTPPSPPGPAPLPAPLILAALWGPPPEPFPCGLRQVQAWAAWDPTSPGLGPLLGTATTSPLRLGGRKAVLSWWKPTAQESGRQLPFPLQTGKEK